MIHSSNYERISLKFRSAMSMPTEEETEDAVVSLPTAQDEEERAHPGKTSKDSKPHNSDSDRGRRGDHGESPSGEEGSNPVNGEETGTGKSDPENG